MDPLIGRVVLDRYEILQRIGAGGMGAVYVGTQRAVGRNVALKVLRTDLMNNEHVRQRFKREAEIIAKLNHPNTIQLIDYGETEEGLAVMVMELLKGLSLSERLKGEGPLPLLDSIRLGEEVCASLAEAHLYGLVHRDLKPANIFLNEVGNQIHAKVLDFGIARLLDEESTRLTSTGQVFGTPRYMSPEQAMSTADVDARSDIYSLGLILYECIVGQPPFVAQTSIQYLSAHSSQDPPKLREHYHEAPVELEQLIDACLEKDPDARPPSADDVKRALEQIRRALEMGTEPPAISIPRGPSAMARNAETAATIEATTGGDQSIRVKESGDRKAPVGTIAFAAGGAMALALAVWFFLQDRPAPMVGEDAGTGSGIIATSLDEPDGGIAMAEVEEPSPDAGEEAASPDAGEPDPPMDAGRRPPPHRKHKRKHKRKPPPPKGPPTGTGVVTGPRGLIIEDLGEGTDPVELAKDCKASDWRGLSKLSTKKCPAGCAIIVDDQCAGLTPAEDRAMTRGRRRVSVVCEGRVKRAATITFEDGDTTVFSCR